MAYYAWSPIVKGTDEKGKQDVVKLGESVSAGDLDMDEDEFQYLIDARAVREQPYPEDLVNSPIPPSEYYKNLLAGAAEGSLSEEESKALSEMNLKFDDSSSSKLAPTSEEVEDVSGTAGSTPKAAASKSE